MLLSSLCVGGCPLAGLWRGGSGLCSGWREAPFAPGPAAVFFRNTMQQLAFLPASTAAARSERLPALVLPSSFSSLGGAFPALL